METNPTIVFTAPREVAIEEREKPTPEAAQLLVRTRRSVISTGTELTVYSGEFPENSAWSDYGSYPFLAGYSSVGEVVAAGPEADQHWIGKRVVTGSPHARYNLIAAAAAQPVYQDRVSDDEAAFHTLAVIVANGVRRAGIGWGESVVIYGAGLLGQLAARFCRLCGARPVIVVDIADARLKLLPDDPAILPVNPTRADLLALVEKATRGRLADVVFEVTGNQNLIVDEFKPLRRQGRFILLSSPRGPTPFDFHDLCNDPSYTIIGTHVGSHPRHGELDLPWTMKRNAELFLGLLADGEIAVAPLITHREPYTEALRLYPMLLKDRSATLGVILQWPD